MTSARSDAELNAFCTDGVCRLAGGRRDERCGESARNSSSAKETAAHHVDNNLMLMEPDASLSKPRANS